MPRILAQEGGSKPKKSAKYRTTIKPRELNPEWMEHFNLCACPSDHALNAKRSVCADALETHAALPAWLHSMDDKSTNMPSVKNGKLVFRIYDHDKIGRDDFIGQGAHRDAAAAGGQVLDQRPRLG